VRSGRSFAYHAGVLGPKAALVVSFALALVSCAAPAEQMPRTEEPVEVAVPTPTAEPTHAPLVAAATAEPVPATQDDSVGIAECDQYLTEMSRCFSKIGDGEVQKQVADSMATMRSAWRDAAKASPDALVAACRAALEALAGVPGCER
jgi:hypothetical protein